ncbi:MAG: hypothetical protein A2751_02510 [Candidatus Doudnabacteria bacterium RIFCSPHIGHO2_01_FULL_46_14]|uniref:Bacterial type II secretion system protein E domain-containing protein n=1 Tax=Candidatus Doudnabacteria bacterium RIFCSPHIGHO2_01_FULL_46_14 TaxID=1817824 RepID=A0A1F5NKB0_9BACT|nr:MAG: hypothetical protein A2751_02510 [Candidatus Doudnabacteria bacterium RIFCSPHIGHO2_01_FULL_46_14]
MISASALEFALTQYRRILSTAPHHEKEIEIRPTEESTATLRALDKAAVFPDTTELLSLIIAAAISAGSSDIHLEPEKEVLKIRFRMDGVLQEITNLPMSVYQHLLSRIKLASNLKLNVTNVPQDGRFSVHRGTKNIDLRISIIPSAYGESIVMRVLGAEEISVDIENLGLSKRDMDLLLAELDKPNGMILTTGPTGSGKTTTLYAFLRYLNRGGVKIITLEDPVEYQIEGITQTPIDHGAGMDFAKGLRSILRQDPDIVMVGEIRDLETAETAAQAALTGHQVLSTLHTNDAAGAIPRFLDLGVKAVTLAPALSALIAQRLLRKICQKCKEIYKPDNKELDRIKLTIATVPKDRMPEHLTFYQSKGCEFCHKIGYKGRVGVFEVFAVDDAIEKLIYESASSQDIKKAALKAGMITMQQDAILKAAYGLTDLAEVWRVTEE